MDYGEWLKRQKNITEKTEENKWNLFLKWNLKIILREVYRTGF